MRPGHAEHVRSRDAFLVALIACRYPGRSSFGS
jgi:hypothetical protein